MGWSQRFRRKLGGDRAGIATFAWGPITHYDISPWYIMIYLYTVLCICPITCISLHIWLRFIKWYFQHSNHPILCIFWHNQSRRKGVWEVDTCSTETGSYESWVLIAWASSFRLNGNVSAATCAHATNGSGVDAFYICWTLLNHITNPNKRWVLGPWILNFGSLVLESKLHVGPKMSRSCLALLEEAPMKRCHGWGLWAVQVL